MPTKKFKHKLIKYRICSVARVIACASFLVLAVIGVSSLVRATSQLVTIDAEDGFPASWSDDITSEHPETITLPITYWDQRQDDCWPEGVHVSNNASTDERISKLKPDRQFEWSICRVYGPGVQTGLVSNLLGSDSLPVPAYASSAETAAAGIHITSQGVNANNFYRWFHEVEGLSQRIDGQSITFQREGNANRYVFGGSGIFPIDGLTSFSDDDSATSQGHNFHFTAHLQVPIRIEADGDERFDFTGDDDVWVFVNDHLVLDIGGVHSAISGYFTINTDGTVNSVVQNGNETITTNNVDIGVQRGDVVNLDFFYAERSTTESNTKITISEMTWPIVAKSSLSSTIEATVTDEDDVVVGSIIQHEATITNFDTTSSVDIERISAHLTETYHSSEMADGETETVSGFVPLETITYSYTPDDPDSWQTTDITLPSASDSGFLLSDAISLDKAGEENDTLTIRYLTASSGETGTMTSDVAFYTTSYDSVSVVHSRATIRYAVPTHKITLHYVVVDGSDPAPADEIYTFKEGFAYSLPTQTLAGYTSDLVSAEGVADTDHTHVITLTRVPLYYDLKISYVDQDGNELHPTYTANLREDSTYNVISPDIDGYECLTSVVTGTITSDLEVVVEYALVIPPTIYHDLTIVYEYADHSTAAPTRTETLEQGSSYAINSPVIAGYTPNLATVSGQLDSSKTVTVTYTKDIVYHSVTINYLYADDHTPIISPYINSYAEGVSFTIPSPDFEGYTADQPSITATVIDQPLVINVLYTKDPDPIYNITVKFVYDDDEQTEAAPAQTISGTTDTEYEFTAPAIDGYTPNQPTITGTIGSTDLEYTVIYTKDADPIVPPVAPVIRPQMPSDPVVQPDSDDELTYTGPLGEVAVVPNTGVVSSMLSPLFDHYFADVILSQGFVLTVLLIFSGSFATYFSLRRYLAFAPAASFAAGSPKRQAAAAKSAKSAKTKAAKSASVTKSVATKSAAKTKVKAAKTKTSKSAKRK